MKQKSLHDVMGGLLQVTITDNGYEISHAAGVACYDSFGYRTTVNGIPEYFPKSISVKGSGPLANLHVGGHIGKRLADAVGVTEANSAIKQLSQTFSQGQLRGDEFNPVISRGETVLPLSAPTLPLTKSLEELEQAYAQWEKTRNKILDRFAQDVWKDVINNLITKAIAQWDTKPSVKR